MPLVYVLDDDIDLGITIRELIKSLGYQCSFFSSSADFIQASKQTLPDIFLVDMWLGKTTAFEVIQENSDLLSGIPSVLISGGGGSDSLEAVTAMADIEGFKKVIYKPFGRTELTAIFEQCLPIT